MIVGSARIGPELAPVSVSTLAPLTGWIDVSEYDVVVAGFLNNDGSTAATLYVMWSNFGTAEDEDTVRSVSVAAGKEGSFEYSETARRYLRVYGESGGTVSLSPFVRGRSASR